MSRPVLQLGKLRDVSKDALLGAFAPLARIENVATAERRVVLRLKAGALPMRDEEMSLVAPGDLFRAVIRHNDRDGKARRIAAVPWTFCMVDEVTTKEVRCQLHTGLRSPLSGRRRGRIEQFALAVIPPQQPSVLTLQSRSDPEQVLGGYEVYARHPDAKKGTLLGRTDRQGRITIPPAECPLRVLLIRNGSEPLARLPIVPGLESELIATVANDDGRLEAEGLITGLQEEIVDLVTRRTVLLARTRARIEAGKFDEAAELVETLNGLQTGPQFASTLDAQRKSIYSNDPAVQAKIDALFSDTRKLMLKYLDPKTVEEVSVELSKARGE